MYFQLFDGPDPPTTGVTVPLYSWFIPAGGLLQLSRSDLAGTGIRFAGGCAWGISSTAGVFTQASPGIVGVVNIQRSKP